jgi:hypothetical protein
MLLIEQGSSPEPEARIDNEIVVPKTTLDASFLNLIKLSKLSRGTLDLRNFAEDFRPQLIGNIFNSTSSY